MKSNDELLQTAYRATGTALDEICKISIVGRERPVPAEMFTTALVLVRDANSALIELERRARGGEIPKDG